MTTIEELAGFVTGTPDEAIPLEVSEYARMILLDTVVSALATARLERGHMVRRLAARLGDAPEALLLGSSDRSSVLGASYANADLMNLLDADETFYNSAHFAAMGLAPALAQAERQHSTGRDLVRATVLSFDVSARLNLGTSLMEYDGEQFRFSQLSSHGYAAFGAATAYGVLSGLDATRLAHAFGLATWLTPTAKNGYMSRRRRFNSLKYAANGQIAHAGVTAAMMAEEGFEGDLDGLDIQPGFLEAQGYRSGDRDAILRDLGSTWWITETSVKPYPSCRYSHAMLDAVVAARRDHDVQVDAIRAVRVKLPPAGFSISQFREPLPEIADDHLAPFHGQFHAPHLVAVALLGIPAGPDWYSPETIRDPRVQELAAKVTIEEDPVLAEEWRALITAGSGERVKRTRGSIVVTTDAGDLTVESELAAGDPWLAETRVTWELLEAKVETFCADLLDADRRKELLEIFRHLDEVEDVAAELVPALLVEG